MWGYIKGVIAATLLVLNLTILPTLVILFTFIKWILPSKRLHKSFDHLTHVTMPWIWVNTNSAILRFANSSKITVIPKGELILDDWYLLICNHQSWLDILIIQGVFNQKIPMLKFFLKQSLIWSIPIGGLACWCLDFPFMKRYTKEQLRKNPEIRAKNIETARKSCEKFKKHPVTITNFVEGTRSTPEKRLERKSPFKHLLIPNAGGIAFSMATMNEQLHKLVNTTIVYHAPPANLWQYICGKPQPITVYYEVLPIPAELRGDYYNDKEFRKEFQQWLNQQWQKKDELITETLSANSRNKS
jgi:1-acyl-sn-glycerol-3-phosphate acyltransferase